MASLLELPRPMASVRICAVLDADQTPNGHQMPTMPIGLAVNFTQRAERKS
jgi:hypothetical protein